MSELDAAAPDGGEHRAAPPPTILFVCTGNICRSPLAERLMRTRLAERGWGRSVRVASAGTGTTPDLPMTDAAARELVRLGGDPGGSRSRAVTAEQLSAAALVVALTRGHRAAAVELHLPALRYAVTLRESSRLLAGADLTALPTDPAERVPALAALLVGRRGRVPVVDGDLDDVPDPYLGSTADYERVTALVAPAVNLLVGALLGDDLGLPAASDDARTPRRRLFGRRR
jgi:protein-tyrosine phosphatase